jgi:hypothetical protein
MQCVVSDLDMFVPHPGSESVARSRRDDGRRQPQTVAKLLSLVDTDMGKDLSKVQFSEMTGVAAVVGYLPEQFSVSLGATKATVAKTMPIAQPKKPWWKFW